MIKRLVAWVLNKYIGKYIENLSAEQLSFSFFEGNISVENLPLKKTNLEHLGLPLAITNGFLGKLNVKIPKVTGFRSEPWILSFEDIVVVLGPVLSDDFDPGAEEAFLLEHKLAELDKLGQSDSDVQTSRYSSSYESWFSYGTNFITDIIENLQVVIKEVHVCYEALDSIRGTRFAFGTTIEELSMQNCDENWKPELVSGNSGYSFKLVKIENMAFYWDTNPEMYGDKSHGELARIILSPEFKKKQLYIVIPTSGYVRIKRNQSLKPIRSSMNPRYFFDFTFESIYLNCNKTQYDQMISCVQMLKRLEPERRCFRNKRPTAITGPRERWKYAINCIVDAIRERWKNRNWPSVMKRASDCLLYVEIYKRYFKDPTVMQSDELEEKERIEIEFGLSELKALRELAFVSVIMPKESSEKHMGFVQSWFPSWTGWLYGTSTGATTKSENKETLFEDELLDDLKDSCENDNVLRRDAFLWRFHFSLKKVICSIASDADVPLLDITGTNVSLNYNMDPLEALSKFKLSINYYNRSLSGWEPLLEPWELSISLKQNEKKDFSLQVSSEETIDLNLTSDLLQLIDSIKQSWLQVERGECSTAFKRRNPFLPYALQNAVGCNLRFSTYVSEVEDAANSRVPVVWVDVAQGDTQGFSFVTRDRARLRDRRKISSMSNKLYLQVEGWKVVGPISVDKVGRFYRHMYDQDTGRPALIIIEISLESSARKLILIRSSVVVVNELHENIEIIFHDFNITPAVNRKKKKTSYKGLRRSSGLTYVKIPPKTPYSLPLNADWSFLRVRPLGDKISVPYSTSMESYWLGASSRPIELCLQCIPVQPYYHIFARVEKEAILDPPMLSRAMSSSSLSTMKCHMDTISFVPPIVLVNLLPQDLEWEISRSRVEGRVRSGKETSIHVVNVYEDTEINLTLEGFTQKGSLLVCWSKELVSVKRLCFIDNKSRRLFLQAKITCPNRASLRVTIFANYWIINNSGLSLIFRQKGCDHDAAGQEEEHEKAQCRMPLMFSFTDDDASVNLVARLGSQLHPGAVTEWCNYFPLSENVRVRRLVARATDGTRNYVYLVGVTVRPGKGRFRDSLIVTISPRFEIHNFSKHRLLIGQKSLVENRSGLSDIEDSLIVMPESSVIFHWPRLNKNQLLCVKMPDVEESRWSGGFGIEEIQSLHISVYDSLGLSHFLHVEVSLQGPTYCVVFTDGDSMPPLYCIDNRSYVSISYYQKGTSDVNKAIVKPKARVPYAWTEPTLKHYLRCEAPGGNSCDYYLDNFGELQTTMEYDNFIYIAFCATFSRDLSPTIAGRATIEHPQLVLEVPCGSNKVKLAPKKQGERSQFWRMTPDGRLEHEGSSPPTQFSPSSTRKNPAMVLDVEAPALQPFQYTNLIIRKTDPRRCNTQTWRFQDGRLQCFYSNLYVQPKGGVDNLRPYADVVIGPSQPVTRLYRGEKGDLPAEQAIELQKFRPGSGSLCARIEADGPTRVLVITDTKETSSCRDFTPKAGSSMVHLMDNASNTGKQLQIHFNLIGGLSMDIISGSPREELAYFKLSGVRGTVNFGYVNQFEFEVDDVRVENMLRTAEHPMALFANNKEARDIQKAIIISIIHLPCFNVNANIFKNVSMKMENMCLVLEEELLFKLLLFFGMDQSDLELERCNDSDLDQTRAKLSASGVQLKRHYVNFLNFELKEVCLSYLTAIRLPPELSKLKRQLGFNLLTRFENAELQLEPFKRQHIFETANFLIDSVKKHYAKEIGSQVVKIFGSCDFLGAPLGFVQDLNEGVWNLVVDGDVGGLFRNVAHGVSNSTVKLTGTLSDTLGVVTMDSHFEEERRRRLRGFSGSSTDRLLAGLEGFKYGIIGGFTSIFTQTYEGTVSDGLRGAITGLGRGIVGTVAKPTIGMLDLAAGTAAAIRNSSRSDSQCKPKAKRTQRLLQGPGGLLPKYHASEAESQQILYEVNHGDFSETLTKLMTINSDEHPLWILLSDRYLRLYSTAENGRNVLKEVELSSIKSVFHSGRNSIEVEEILSDGNNSPRQSIFVIKCAPDIVKNVIEEIQYSKSVFDENRHQLPPVKQKPES